MRRQTDNKYGETDTKYSEISQQFWTFKGFPLIYKKAEFFIRFRVEAFPCCLVSFITTMHWPYLLLEGKRAISEPSQSFLRVALSCLSYLQISFFLNMKEFLNSNSKICKYACTFYSLLLGEQLPWLTSSDDGFGCPKEQLIFKANSHFSRANECEISAKIFPFSLEFLLENFVVRRKDW